MKHFVFLLIVVSVVMGETRANDSDKCASASEQYMAHSEWWPERVSLTRSWHSPVLDRDFPAGTRAVLVRAEPGCVVVDFGHPGVARLPYEATDFDRGFDENRLERTWESPGLWGMQLMMRTFTYDGRTAKLLEPTYFEGVDYYILYYGYAGDAPTRSLLEEVVFREPGRKALGGLAATVFVPLEVTRADFAQSFDDRPSPLHFMFPPFSAPYADILQHGYEPGSASLMDKNGKLLVAAMPCRSPEQWEAFLTKGNDAIEREAAQRACGQ